MPEFLVSEGVAFVGQEHAEAPTRVYKFFGVDTEIDVETAYDERLGEVRRLRAERDRGGTSTATASKNQFMERCLPEDIINYLDALPQKSLIRRIVLLDSGLLHEKARICAARQSGNWVYLPDAITGDTTRRDLLHSWAHLAKVEFAREARIFECAAHLEEDGFFGNDDSRNLEENWAHHFSHHFMADDFEVFKSFCSAAPLRAVALSRVLQRSLDTAIGPNASPHAQKMRERVAYVEKNVISQALNVVGQLLQNDTYPEKEAIGMAFYLGVQETAFWNEIVDLDLSYELITEAELATVLNSSDFQNLREINLAGTLIGKKGLEVISKLLNLETVSVADTLVEDLRPATKLLRLRYLDLRNTRVATRDLSNLVKCPSLSVLNVSGTEVTELGVETIKSHLPVCHVIRD